MFLKVFLFLSLSAFILIGYQNCGNVQLQSTKDNASAATLLQGTIHGKFCPSVQPHQNYDLQEFFVINLTARASRFSGDFLADSDMDGVPDIEEEGFNLDPLNRRTLGVLDTFCVEAGGNDCDPKSPNVFLSFGLRTTDIRNLNLNGSYGEDQDQDGIPDFIELLFGTFIHSPDAYHSTNNPNGETNISKIKKGLAPRTHLDSHLPSSYHVLTQVSPDEDLNCGSMQGYDFQVHNLPLAQTKAFSSSDEPYLSHEKDENLILFLVVSVKANGEQEVSYVLKRVFYNQGHVDIQIDPSEFQLITEHP